MIEGSIWFRRFKKEVQKMSPHFRFVPIQWGWYRIYWTGGGQPAYIHEVWKWMPYREYRIEEKDRDLDSRKYYEEFEEQRELNRKVKNYVEGYWDSIQTMQKRLYQLRNNKEFRDTAVKAYRYIRVK